MALMMRLSAIATLLSIAIIDMARTLQVMPELYQWIEFRDGGDKIVHLIVGFLLYFSLTGLLSSARSGVKSIHFSLLILLVALPVVEYSHTFLETRTPELADLTSGLLGALAGWLLCSLGVMIHREYSYPDR